ncbi:SgcJ/EcaC family oxidoreductase [Hymenobacter sp. HMF4947]|uniref:SgcJ/EcaC family oxidoreductase n=1 Tax=Hymenobacter ginkgonis TaxID=2682976 RepID=A0A7K1TIM4_9BACT|nr:SgcJ/EcaC family oxidoreductase [Hymenobacter ginkgonis]MVN78258.1 SgcJ/EcaC family oxidoreductase [Hymenobacter ginkgonis]
MKSCLPFLIALASSHLAAAQTTTSPLPATDKEAIVATLQHFQKNLNDHKFSEMVEYTTPDVTAINIVGMLWEGEPAVQKGHQVVFDKLYKDVRFPPMNVAALSLRPLTPDVVLVVRGSKPLPPGVPPHPQTANTTVLVKRQGRWLIAAFQNTLVDAKAAADDPTLAKE